MEISVPKAAGLEFWSQSPGWQEVKPGRCRTRRGEDTPRVEQMPKQQLPGVFCLMWYTSAPWMKGWAHFTNLKGSFQVLQFHVGRKAETIADIITSSARVGQIRGQDEALETQGLRPLDQLLGNLPVAVDVELEPSEAAGGSCRDFLQRGGGVRAGDVTGVHRFGRFGRYWKTIRTKVISVVPPDTRYRSFLYTTCRKYLNSCFICILPNMALYPLANMPPGLKMAAFTMHCYRIMVKKAGKKEVIYQAVLSFHNWYVFFLKQELYDCVPAGMHCQMHCVHRNTHGKKNIFPRVSSPNPPWGLGREIMLFSKGDTVFTHNKEFTGWVPSTTFMSYLEPMSLRTPCGSWCISEMCSPSLSLSKFASASTGLISE